LTPPKKWSYFKLVIRFAFLSFVALVVYIWSVMGSASTPSSLPVKLYGLFAQLALVIAACKVHPLPAYVPSSELEIETCSRAAA